MKKLLITIVITVIVVGTSLAQQKDTITQKKDYWNNNTPLVSFRLAEALRLNPLQYQFLHRHVTVTALCVRLDPVYRNERTR